MGDSVGRWGTELYGAVIEASPDPIVVFAEDSTVRLWNPAAEAKFGYGEEAVLGRRFTDLDLVPSAEMASLGDRRRRAFEEERFDGGQLERYAKGVDRLHLGLSKAPLWDDDGTVTAVVTIKEDISEQRRLESRLSGEIQRLDEFASILSHDIRHPLTIARSYLELPREEGEGRYFDEVHEAHRRMEALIEDLLAIARGGVSEHELGSVDIGEMAEECWRFIDDWATTLAVRSAADLDADRGGLRQVFDNLIQNAVDHGGQHVVVGVMEDGSGFYVEDDGPGVPVDRRDEILEKGHTTRHDGTGYGLSIVPEVAEAHGWKVGVTGGEHGGARFEVSGVAIDG